MNKAILAVVIFVGLCVGCGSEESDREGAGESPTDQPTKVHESEDTEKKEAVKTLLDWKKNLETRKGRKEQERKQQLEERRKTLLDPNREAPWHEQLVAASRQFPDGKMILLGDTITFGDLTLTPLSFGVEKRTMIIASAFSGSDLEEPDLWGLLLRVKNTSPGRIVYPFSGSIMGDNGATDNWGNTLYPTKPSRSGDSVVEAHFATADKKLLPSTEQTYLLPVRAPEVPNIEYFVMSVHYCPVERF